MDKRTVLALVLIFIVLFFFQYLFSPKEQPVKPQETPVQKEAVKEPSAPEKKVPVTQSATEPATRPAVQRTEKQPKRDVIVETPLYTATFTDLGGAIKELELKKYKEAVKGKEGKSIIENIKPFIYVPKIVTGKNVDDRENFTPDRHSLTVTDSPQTLTFTGTLSDGRKVKKIYTFDPGTYIIDMKIEGNLGEKYSVEFATISGDKPSGYTFKGPFVYNGKKLEQIDKIKEPLNFGETYGYAGFDEGYFAFIFIPEETTKPNLSVLKTDTGTPFLSLTGTKGEMNGKLYFGPKETDILKTLNVKAEKIVDFGWFDIIAKPLIFLLNLSNRVTHNYGIDIILLTILIKIIFYPLSIKSFKQMKGMQKLQPQIAKIKEKYKNDKQKLNQEVMDLYKRQKVNPMGGCLPMLIQIPVFFALYKALSGAIELRHADFIFWINDLSAPENLYALKIFGYSIPIRVLPLVMGATQFIQQKMTPTSADPMQEKMMLFMPILFTFLFYGFSSGLVLYWLVNNVIAIAQQYYYNKKAA